MKSKNFQRDRAQSAALLAWAQAPETQYAELVGNVIYYTDSSDKSEHVARLVKVMPEGCILEDIAPPTYPQGYSWSEVGAFKLAPQTGWE